LAYEGHFDALKSTEGNAAYSNLQLSLAYDGHFDSLKSTEDLAYIISCPHFGEEV
jgi:hypothetical protein